MTIQRGALTSGASSAAKPSGVVAGDLILVAVFRFNSNPAAPSGFTLLSGPVNNSGDSRCRTSIFYKIAGGSEPSSYSSSGGLLTVCIAFQGGSFDAADPFGNSITTNSGDGATVTYTTSVTTDNNNALLVAAAWGGDSAPGVPSGMSSLGSVNSGEGGFRFVGQVIASAGATGSRTSTMTSDVWNAHAFSINPPPPPSAHPRFFAQLIG